MVTAFRASIVWSSHLGITSTTSSIPRDRTISSRDAAEACPTRSDIGTWAEAMARPPATPRRSRTPDSRGQFHVCRLLR
jgi:hypothetical protein